MTHRHYYTDAYRREFTATVLERSADGTRLYLDETAFYPTSGGQPHDLGTLGGVDVVDVVDEDSRIAHVVSRPIDAVEPRLVGRIDWTRRYDHMQQHTGQHLLSAVFEDLFGAKTVSVHFGPESSTLDLDVEGLTREQIVTAESRANDVVGEARPVLVTFEDAATAQGLRKASERAGTLRIVSIEGVDRSACGGTHVRTTAEIGAVLVRSSEKVRKTTRVEFVCGRRALRRARRDLEALSAIAGSLSSSLDDAPAVVATQGERLRDADNVRKKLDRELSAYRVRERYDATTPDAGGVRTHRRARRDVDRRVARARAGGVRAAARRRRRGVGLAAVRAARVVGGFRRRRGQAVEGATGRRRRTRRRFAAPRPGQRSRRERRRVGRRRARQPRRLTADAHTASTASITRSAGRSSSDDAGCMTIRPGLS